MARLTLTAIHPTENYPVPSRHIPLEDDVALCSALERLHAANRMGWGAFFGVATRQPGLTRWQRGGMADLIETPALIADIDEPPEVVLPRLQAVPIRPSITVSSGQGVHLYFLLAQPTTDNHTVNAVHRGLAAALGGDYLTAATAIRLPGSQNTKRGATIPCEILDCDWSRRYILADFAAYRKETSPKTNNHIALKVPARFGHSVDDRAAIQVVTDTLLTHGYKWRGTWLNGPCPNSECHKHGDRRASFGFNTATGYAYCFVCGTLSICDIV